MLKRGEGALKLISTQKYQVNFFTSAAFEETRPWVASHCAQWLQKVIEDDPVAKSCGRKGFQILHGVLEKQIDDGGSVTSHFFTRHAPTYYGMMTVVFEVN